MTFCPCCDAEPSERFPDSCVECGARFEHEAELSGEDWKPRVSVVQHGEPCMCAEVSRG